MMEVLSIEELNARGKSVKQIVTESVKLSEVNISNYHTGSNEISNWVRLREMNKPFFVAGYVGETLVGQCAMTLLNESEYKQFLAGSFNEDKIVGKELTRESALIGYISTLTIVSEYRTGINLIRLLRGFFEQIEESLVNGMSFKAICASAYSKSGAKMMRAAGFTQIDSVNSKSSGINFTATWNDILSSRLMSIVKKRSI